MPASQFLIPPRRLPPAVKLTIAAHDRWSIYEASTLMACRSDLGGGAVVFHSPRTLTLEDFQAGERANSDRTDQCVLADLRFRPLFVVNTDHTRDQ